MTEGKKGSMKPEQVVAQAVAEGGQEYRWAGRRGNPPRARDDFHNEDTLRFAPNYRDRGLLQNNPEFVRRCKLLEKNFGDQDFTVEQALGLFTAQQPKRLNRRRESLRWMIESGRLVHIPAERA